MSTNFWNKNLTELFKITSTCKGGGYMYCRTEPPHPKRNAKGLYPLHRVLMENKLGRILDKTEIVHHIDEDKNNNSINNLAILSSSEHAKHHALVDSLTLNCAFCNKKFSMKPGIHRRKLKRNKSGFYCSLACAGSGQRVQTIHGTHTAYKRGCRCVLCLANKSKAQAEYKKRKTSLK